MKKLKNILSDKRGATDMVFKLVLAITIAAALMVIILQLLHQVQDSGVSATKTAGEGLKNFAENVSQELSG
jgi:preprotein translocase subunit SecG